MTRIRFLTSGESHGRALSAFLEGMPAGLPLAPDDINSELRRRQGGYGRGGRMKIEEDTASILSGVRWGRTIGSPITLVIENRDWQNWQAGMSGDEKDAGSIPPVTRPRPGHADLAGALKFGHRDLRNVLERSSARETAARVALGAIAKKFLLAFGIRAGSYVLSIGKARWNAGPAAEEKELLKRFEKAEESDVRCPDEKTALRMKKLIDEATEKGDSLGGVFEVFLAGVPPGLGSYVQWDRRLDGRLSQALMSVQAIKAVEVGLGFEMAEAFGSEAMDEIFYEQGVFGRRTNNAGGLEGGMTNGMPVLLRAAMKPIPTQKRPLMSVDIISKEAVSAAYERSDVCAVPAASVIAEAMAALVIAESFLEKFGGDSMDETKRNFGSFMESVRRA